MEANILKTNGCSKCGASPRRGGGAYNTVVYVSAVELREAGCDELIPDWKNGVGC
jgi:hypothetical protein